MSICRPASVSSNRLEVVFDDGDDECFTTQDDHVTVDTVQARLATTVKSELCKFSAVADQEKMKVIQGHVLQVCQRNAA